MFSFNSNDPKGPARTEEGILQDSKEALELRKSGKKDKHVNGIKGRNWFMSLSYFHLVKGVAIDYMHGILLGVQKKPLQLWCLPEFSKAPLSISGKVSILDKRLLHVKPPSVINRTPRNISNSLKYWKASEYHSFLLFYGVPLLCGLLPDIYLHCHILFVRGIFLLLKDNITEQNLAAEGCFIEFVAKFNIIYEIKFATLNFHQLVHLVDQVRQLGALWTHACFTFEDKIRVILKFIHGSQYIDGQIITAVSFTQKVPELIQDYVDDTCGVKTLKDQLTSAYLPKIQEKLSEHIYRLGALHYNDMIVEEFDALTSYFGCVPLALKCQCFTRIVFKKKVLIYGTDYR